MYRVAVLCEVPTTTNSNDIPLLVFRELDLPFAPTVGLEFNLNAEWWCGPLQSVSWLGDMNFVCYIKPNTRLIDTKSIGTTTPEEFLDFLTSMGWLRYGNEFSKPSFFKQSK